MKLSRNHIKLIAILTMFCDHATKLFVSQKTLGYTIGRKVIGRIAFPLFGALLVEGFFKTKNKELHIFRLLILALISEPLYDIVLNHGWEKQSIIVTWFLSYIMLYIFDSIDHSKKIKKFDFAFVLKIMLLLGFCQLAYLIKVDYSYAAILATYIAYEIYRSSKISVYWKPVISIALFGLSEGLIFKSWGALLAIIPGLLYSSIKRSKTNTIYRQLLYWSYPIHLCVLWITCLLLTKNGL